MKSLWMEGYESLPEKTMLQENLETDTAIVGGGLAGILCAHMLKQRGIDAVVVEAKRAGMGVTRNTTAKITAQHGAVYSNIERQYGFHAAREYLRANQDAVARYQNLARQFPCDFEEKTAFVYSKNNRKQLEREADLYRRMGLTPVFQDKPPIPVNTVGALGMERQAQFHPLKFLSAISKGLKIYENSFVTDLQPGKVTTQHGSITARRIILATHFPMLRLRGLYFMKLYQHRSYVLALEGADDPGALYLDTQESGLSFRTHGGLLLLGGGSHRTGKQGGGWDELRRFAARNYPSAKERYAWATQDCMSLDAVPYIGSQHEKNRALYLATGFNKWGMTGSMVAATLLSELIADGTSRYAALFDPGRSMLHPQLLLNMGDSALGLLSFGKRCPHMGCALKWNRQEHTWDCPCHGSRFDRRGNLIDNPAKRGIEVE